jgi:hypothetical protein
VIQEVDQEVVMMLHLEFFRKDIPATSTVNATEQGLNLEEGDAIKAQAETASKLEIVVSYALIDRQNENG